MKIDKIIRIGVINRNSVYCHIRFDGSKLSISGVIGPMRNGDARGSVGQIDADIRDAVDYNEIKFVNGFTLELTNKFLDVWDRWHLNDMRAGCEHQRAEEWHKKPIDSMKPLTAYGIHFYGQTNPSYNALVWVRPNEHPNGLLGQPCKVCGYQYGTKWLHEDVPDDVLKWLNELPDTDIKPAWV